MRFFIVTALLGTLLLSSSCATTSKSKERAKLHLQIGTSYLSGGNYPAALKELLEAERLDPENAVIQNNLAIAYFVRDKHSDAEQRLLKALEIDPLYTDARNNLGRVYTEAGKYDLAIQELQRVVDDLTYPNPEKGLTNLGIAQMKAGQYPSSNKTLSRALKVNRNYCPAQQYYGMNLYHMQNYEKAAQALDAAIHLCKDLDEAHYYNALTYDKLGEVERASTRMKELLELFPESRFREKARSYLAKASEG